MREFGDARFGLVTNGTDWVPWIWFTDSRDRATFLEIADWIQSQFDLQLVEKYGSTAEDAKEYWTYTRNSSKWMLMRCYYPLGISLDGYSPYDLSDFEKLARQCKAKPVGWRYRFARFQRRFFAQRFGAYYLTPADNEDRTR